MAEHAAYKSASLSCWFGRLSSWYSRGVFLVVLAVAVAGGAGDAQAAELAPPSSEVILKVKGPLGRTNVGDEAHLDRPLLESFGTTTLTTWTPWTDGEVEFEGLPLRSLVAALEARGTAMHMRALNDYRVVIPMSDAQDYNVLLAWRADGVDLTRRDRGPLWIVYPWSAHPDLDIRVTSHRSIWQLHELEFHDE